MIKLRIFLKKLNNNQLKIYYHDRNYGKGKAIQTGIKDSTGDIIIIQDADLEYSPKDYPILIKPFFESDSDVVYGSRFLGGTDMLGFIITFILLLIKYLHIFVIFLQI